MSKIVLPEGLHAVIFYGRPYSSKGTIADLLKERFGISIFSMSSALKRYGVDLNTPPAESEHISSCMAKGKLVAREVSLKAFLKALQTHDMSRSPAISFDGVPRDPLQVEWFSHVSQITVLNFVVSREDALKRRLGRISEAVASGGPIRPDDESKLVAEGRQDDFDSLDGEMLRLLRQLAEDDFYTIDASDATPKTDRVDRVVDALIRSGALPSIPGVPVSHH